ncbi:MAG: hypothetical protein AAGJ35_13560, partial [Myxococcota bacterium]
MWNVTLGHFSALDFEAVPLQLDAPDHDEEEETMELLLQPNTRSTLVMEDQILPEKEDHLPSIAFSEDGSTLGAIQDGVVLWRRQLPSIIATVYGIQQDRWTSLDVLEEAPLITDASVALLPSAPPKDPQHSVFVDMLWEQIHNEYPASLLQSSSGLVVYQAECHADGTCSTAPSDVPALAGTSPRVPLLQLEGPSTPSKSIQVQPEGLLITWNMVMGVFWVLVTMALGLYKVYQSKKRKWINTPLLLGQDDSRMTPPPPLALPGPATSSEFRSSSFKRSQSLPVIHSETASHPASEEVDEPQPPDWRQEMPSDIDGIPLVRYSRYDSEFKELNALGKGGFGSVVQCQNRLDGRHYALKKILIQPKQQLQKVLREVK